MNPSKAPSITDPSVEPAIWLIIPCAGTGSRVGADIPKQYLSLNNETVLEQTLRCFLSRNDIQAIVLAVASNDTWVRNLPLVQANAARIHFAEGGRERSDSVASALVYIQSCLSSQNTDLVAIHDAARPCVIQKDLDAVIAAARVNKAGALLAVPSFNTLKQAVQSPVNSEQVLAVSTINRATIWQAYTPQVFPLLLISAALKDVKQKQFEVTDDSSAVEVMGMHPTLVEGAASNIKITRFEDLALAEFYLQQGPR